jgi:hypothetical protein
VLIKQVIKKVIKKITNNTINNFYNLVPFGIENIDELTSEQIKTIFLALGNNRYYTIISIIFKLYAFIKIKKINIGTLIFFFNGSLSL